MKKNINLDIPKQLELLSSLLETTPQQLLQGFIDDLCRTQQSNGSDERILAGEYFLRCGYGMHCFDYDQAEEMLSELDCIRYAGCHCDNEKEQRRHIHKRIKEWYTTWKKIKTGKGKK
jgi:hypothetical protein